MNVHVHGYGIGQVWLHLAYKHVQFGLVVVIEVLQQLDNQFSNTFCFFLFQIYIIQLNQKNFKNQFPKILHLFYTRSVCSARRVHTTQLFLDNSCEAENTKTKNIKSSRTKGIILRKAYNIVIDQL